MPPTLPAAGIEEDQRVSLAIDAKRERSLGGRQLRLPAPVQMIVVRDDHGGRCVIGLPGDHHHAAQGIVYDEPGNVDGLSRRRHHGTVLVDRRQLALLEVPVAQLESSEFLDEDRAVAAVGPALRPGRG